MIFTSTSPFIFYKLIPHHPYKILVFLGLLIISVSILLKKSITNFDYNIVLILLLQINACFIFFAYHQFKLGADFKYINLALQFITNLFLYIFISTFFNIKQLVQTNIYVIATMALLGALIFILLLTGFWRSFGSFQGPSWETQNYIFTTAGAVWLVENVSIIRVGGFFDEPGTFAFYIIFALICNKLLGFSDKCEKVLIFCGILTFSVTFFISLFFYYIIIYFKFKNLKYFIIFSLLLIFFNNYIQNNKNDSRILNVLSIMSIDRLLISNDSDKFIDGDTRSEPTKIALNAFIKAPFLGHGLSVTERSNSEYYNLFLGANIFTPFAYHGFFGVIIFYLLYIYWTVQCIKISLKNLNKIVFASWFIITINLLQRPDAFIGSYGYFVFIFLITSTKSLNQKFNESII
jgi:hypothetical protein